MKAELGNTPADKNYKPSGIDVPNKIYVGIQDLGSGYATSISLNPQEGHSEYIRKDALVEFLYQIIEHNGNKEGYVPRGAVAACKDIITYINSL